MKHRTKLAIMALLCPLLGILGQQPKIKKAANAFGNYAYMDAIESYEDLVKKGYTDNEIFKNLGNANYFNANYSEAAGWYERLFKTERASVDPEYMYRYAQSLKSRGDYKASDRWMKKFERATKNDDNRINKLLEKQNYRKDIEEQSGRYTIRFLSINSSTSDFAPSLNGTQMVFATARDTGLAKKNIHEWNKAPFLNLYRGEYDPDNDKITGIAPLSKNLNTKTHESSTTFTKDGTTMYFTRNNSRNRSFRRDAEGVSRLKLYKATLDNGEWSDIRELPFNSDDFSIAHPALSPDGTKLYFASDMPGSLGLSDIFYVDINMDGSYGEPINLGNKINTEARETFPFVSSSNVLYFASDGHPGLGGLDVFAIDMKDPDNSLIANVGMPVNGPQDDFSFVVDEDMKKGFFASNRSGGIGSDDIYGFKETKPLDLRCLTTITGTVIDKESGDLLENAGVVLVDQKGETVSKTLTQPNGAFELDGNCKKGTYRVDVSKDDYEPGNETFSVMGKENTAGVVVKLSKTEKLPAVGTDLMAFLELEPIYFDFDKWNIRKDAEPTLKKVVSFMTTFPQINIQIGAHTDSRAGKTYNTKLSDKRAKSTMEYLVKNGIAADRLSPVGFGESKLVNECVDAVPCSKEKHQKNRRSEFRVVE